MTTEYVEMIRDGLRSWMDRLQPLVDLRIETLEEAGIPCGDDGLLISSDELGIELALSVNAETGLVKAKVATIRDDKHSRLALPLAEGLARTIELAFNRSEQDGE